MSSLNLNSLDEHLMTRIVKKFNTARAGARFYRSCRGARDFVEQIKPVWPLPDSNLEYDSHFYSASLSRGDIICYSKISASKVPVEFCKIERVKVPHCNEELFENFVLPHLGRIGAVGTVCLDHVSGRIFSEEQVMSLLEAAKAEIVDVLPDIYDVISPAFKNVQNLYCTASYEQDVPFLQTKKIFGFMANWKTITWASSDLSTKTITLFIENWLKGESTGSLEKLTVKHLTTWGNIGDIDLLHMDIWYMQLMEEALNRPEIQNLAKSCVRDADGWILEREGAGQIRICLVNKSGAYGSKVEFYFS